MREEGVHVVPEDAAGDLPDEADALGEGVTGGSDLHPEDEGALEDVARKGVMTFFPPQRPQNRQ